jgi:DNA-binding IclR family transcriptional regulator
VLPALQELVRETGESAAYHVRQGNARLCLYRVDSPHPIRDHVYAGEILPLYRGTGGRVLVAFDKELLEGVPSEEGGIYRKIVEQGFCATTGARLAEGAGISAPVFRQNRQMAGALTLTMPVHRYNDHYIEQVIKAAKELSDKMP